MMAADATGATQPNEREVLQLWALACALADQQQLPQALVCVETCSRAAMALAENAVAAPAPPKMTPLVARMHLLLAELCLTLCATEEKASNRELWWKRYKRAEEAVQMAALVFDGEVEDGNTEQREWYARLIKCKYLYISQQPKLDTAARNRQILEHLCDGIRVCASETASSANMDELNEYFCAKLRASLAEMHSASMLARRKKEHVVHADLEANLNFVRSSIPQTISPTLMLWLIEVSCHVLVTSSRFGSGAEMAAVIEFADRWVANQPNISPDLHVYHLIVKCFHLLRNGQVRAMEPLVEQLKNLYASAAEEQQETSQPTLVNEAFLSSIIDGLVLEVTSRHDPCQAMALSMQTIHRVQSNLQTYSENSDVQVMLLGALFDMLYIHCNIHAQQSRYFEMAVSIAQMLQLFMKHKAHLKPTGMYAFYLAQTHILIAKYATAIGKHSEARSHLRYVLESVLPPINPDERSYSQRCLTLWIDLLDVSLYCSAVADPAFVIHPENSSELQILHISPSKQQLAIAGKILETDGLQALVYDGGSEELRARYDIALCKWMWATQELGLLPQASGRGQGQGRTGFRLHEILERYRPDTIRILQESLERVSTHVNCTESTAEIMALFGPQLIDTGHLDNGEETLKNAIRLSLHAKNVLLQTRLLVDISRLYEYLQLENAVMATAKKYEKKVTLLQRRIAQAQDEKTTNDQILYWSAKKA